IDSEAMPVLHQHVPVVVQLGFLTLSHASTTDAEAWVALVRRSPWKFTVGLPGSSGVGGDASFRWKLLRLAHASINVPSTVKCSSDRKPRPRAWANTRSKKTRATSPASNRSRFFVNTVASQTGSSISRPTNQRKSRL